MIPLVDQSKHENIIFRVYNGSALQSFLLKFKNRRHVSSAICLPSLWALFPRLLFIGLLPAPSTPSSTSIYNSDYQTLSSFHSVPRMPHTDGFHTDSPLQWLSLSSLHWLIFIPMHHCIDSSYTDSSLSSLHRLYFRLTVHYTDFFTQTLRWLFFTLTHLSIDSTLQWLFLISLLHVFEKGVLTPRPFPLSSPTSNNLLLFQL